MGLLIKISIFLNLCLLLYLSLSAGSKISLGSQPSHPHPAPLAEPSSSFRENINKHEGHSDKGTKPDQTIEKSCDTGEETRPVTKFSLSENVSCLNKAIEFSQGIRSRFWVLYNYIRAAREFNCNETITYTTHGDFTFLDNLEPLLERWQGPISVAVYSPGSDLDDTID